MKKIYLALALIFAFALPGAFAQNTNPCNPEFSIQVVSTGTIQVTPVINVTTNEIHHAWRFGDNTNDFTTAPSHTYAAGGTYTVRHILYRSNTAGAVSCIDSVDHVITIVFPCNLSAQFTSQAASTNSLGIQFTNTSAGFNPGDSIKWSFGDGTFSYDVNPYHVYTNAGTYNVCLRVKRNGLSTTVPCVSEICHTVTVTAPFICNLSVSFISAATPNGANVISFTNTSTGYASGDTLVWNFGDGTTSSLPNPTHTYTTAGTYHVCLIIKRVVPPGVAPCQNYICHDVVVTLPVTCNLQASYTVSATTVPLQYHFTNTSTGFNTGDSIRWSFGDGTFSFDVNPNHTYANAGTYTVCVWVKKNNNTSSTPCISEWCAPLTVVIPCNLHAVFTYQIDPAQPGHVIFTNTSTGMIAGDSTIWTFSDGTHAYTTNTDHVFTANGNYTVCLKVKRNQNNTAAGCMDDTCVVISITLPNPCNLVVGFDAIAGGAGSLPNHFTFINNTTGYAAGDSVTWSFGDGTFAYTYNADHTYLNNGNYTVCLRVKKNTASGTTPCIREFCKTISVTLPTTCNLHAAFYDSMIANTYTHLFYNNTTPFNAADSVRWTFGDGTSSNAQNPSHTYAQPGTYNVCLRVQQRNPNGVLTSCVSEYCHQAIVAQPVCNIQPVWSHTSTATNPLLVVFTNHTVLPVSAASATWSFGDGTTAAGWNQTHVYPQPGAYYVCLRIQYGNCIVYKCDSVHVLPLPVPCNQLANFHTLTPSAAGNSITVTPNNISNDVTYTWTFGDGTGSHDITASHTYANAGTYTVCLTAYRNNQCAATSCLTMQVPNCNYAALNFNDTRDPLIPNKVTFTAVSNNVITDQVWTITKLPATSASVTIHQNNPVYVFPDTGYYNVCLKATFAGGCVKTVCKQIHITQVAPSGANACSVQVYPNPATTEINAVLTLSQASLINAYVYNSLNILVAQKQQQGVSGSNTVSINIASLPAGVYIMKLMYAGQVCYVTFVK